ncbi:fimbrillin family protein [Phocaeicola abscessus]|uniref:fimbrillin family protein n=1 Tax=Phocaeicola abscessus TaxID=555313 RepID=UPI0018DBAF5B|nr:fimbrillin family protein [Phocaeicola abscessus]
MPANVADQKDLLVAASTDRPGNSNAAEPLTMKHALTAVRFVTGDDMLAGTVSKITLKNVYGTGKLPMQAAPAWYSLSGARNFELTLSPAATVPDPQVPNTPLTTAAATFMMLPQTLPSGAQIEVKYTDKLTNTQRTLTANIAGKTWPMGKTVVYRISTSSISVTSTLEVTAPAEYTYQGGNNTYTVKSYASVSGGGATANVPIAWEVEYSTDNGGSWSNTKPAWLTAFTESGAGGTSAAYYTATVERQTGVENNSHNAALQAATPVNDGINGIYELSTKGGTTMQRTANCYIINAPGRYKLPLVYGNAVDYVKVPGTGNNTSAYTSSAPASGNILSTFINHRGVGITNPYIYNNANCTPAKCTLIWQDAQNLVTNVALSADRHFLQFTVGQATICQGNAVVAVRDASNTVLWSWHIWVTDYRPGTIGTTTPDKEITNYQNRKYKIMTVNLGWCDGKEETYAERTVQVRFKQRPTAGYTSATPKTFTVKQKAQTITELGNSTYYQWGRKDPFVGALEGPGGSSNSINKTWYDASGTTHTNQLPAVQSFPTGTACITRGITTPGTFNANSYMDGQYYNLWDANNNTTSTNDNLVVKTIYDPCPAGYKLPPSNVFTGFTTTGQGTSTQSQFNVQGPWAKGWHFHCGLNHTGDTVFFPTSGYRNNFTAVPSYVGSYAYYWTTGPGSAYGGWTLYFHSGYVNPLVNYNRSSGFEVRVCQE